MIKIVFVRSKDGDQNSQGTLWLLNCEGKTRSFIGVVATPDLEDYLKANPDLIQVSKIPSAYLEI